MLFFPYVKNIYVHNCSRTKNGLRENKIEINKRFGMPIFIPLIGLICCFLLSSRKSEKRFSLYRYLHLLIGFIGFAVLVVSEIFVRYSGISWNHTVIYYAIPIGLFFLFYLFLIKAFKYENLA